MVSIKKNRDRAWVTFIYVPTHQIDKIAVSGEWNGWKEEPLRLNKNGTYSLSRVLKLGNTFEFGYKINESEWVTDESCPSVTSSLGTKNSLLEL